MTVVFCAGIAQAGSSLSETPRSISWQLQPGESLNGLAALIYPPDKAMQQRFIAATKQLNKQQTLVADPGSAAVTSTQIAIPDLKHLSARTALKTPSVKKSSLVTETSTAQPVTAGNPAQQKPLDTTVLTAANSEAASPALMKEYEQLSAKNAEQKQQLDQLNARLQGLQKIADETLKQLQAIAEQEALMAELAIKKQAAEQAAIQAAAAANAVAAEANKPEPAQPASNEAVASPAGSNPSQPALTQPGFAQTGLTKSDPAQSGQAEASPGQPSEIGAYPEPSPPVTNTAAVEKPTPLKMVDLSAKNMQDPAASMNADAKNVLASNANSAFSDLWSEKMFFPLLMTVAALIGMLLIYRWRVKPLSLPTLMFQPSLWPAFARTLGKDMQRPPVVPPPSSQHYVERRAANIERRSPDAGKIQEPAYQAIYNNYKSQEEAQAKIREMQAALASSLGEFGTTGFGNTLAPEPVITKPLVPKPLAPNPLVPQSVMPQNSQAAAASLKQMLAESQQLLRDHKPEASASVLQGYIEARPKQSVMPWLYLLELQIKLRHKKTFGHLARRMHDTFDPLSPAWADAATGVVVESSASNFANIQQELEQIWQNERTSFSTEVMKEIVVLQEVLKAGNQSHTLNSPAISL